MATAQQACVYAAFILDGGDAASIQKVAKAAGVDVPQSLADAFGKTFKTQKLDSLLKNVSFGGGSAAPAAAASSAPAAEEKKGGGKKEEKKKAPEPEPEEDDDMMGGLF